MSLLKALHDVEYFRTKEVIEKARKVLEDYDRRHLIRYETYKDTCKYLNSMLLLNCTQNETEINDEL